MQPTRGEMRTMIRRSHQVSVLRPVSRYVPLSKFDCAELSRMRIKWNQPKRHRFRLYFRQIVFPEPSSYRTYTFMAESVSRGIWKDKKLFMWCFRVFVRLVVAHHPNHMNGDRKLVNLFYDFFARAYICLSISICSKIVNLIISFVVRAAGLRNDWEKFYAEGRQKKRRSNEFLISPLDLVNIATTSETINKSVDEKLFVLTSQHVKKLARRIRIFFAFCLAQILAICGASQRAIRHPDTDTQWDVSRKPQRERITPS